MARDPGLHTRVVAILKVSLPLIAVGLLAGLFLTPPDQPTDSGGLEFSPGDTDAFGGGFSLSNATFVGTTAGQDSFDFTAALVEPDAAPPTRAAITTLTGDFTLHKGPTIKVDAASGDLAIEPQRLDLGGGVRLESSDGYTMVADTVTLDLKSGALVAGNRVETLGPLGQIDSDSLHIAPATAEGESRRFSFAGGVRVLYDPPDTR